MKKVIDVNMNGIECSTEESPIIGTTALATCVGFLAYDSNQKKAIVSHLAPSDKNSIIDILNKMKEDNFINDIEYQKKFDWLGLSSLDIFIPSLRLAVEYDGGYFHKNRRTSDEYKTNICKSHGIRVIRIIEQIDKVSEKVYVDKNVVFYQYQKS